MTAAAEQTLANSIASAEATKATSLAAAQASFVAALTAAGPDVGYNLQSGNYAVFAAAVASANAAKSLARFNAEVQKQSSVQIARDTLKSTGDTSPV